MTMMRTFGLFVEKQPTKYLNGVGSDRKLENIFQLHHQTKLCCDLPKKHYRQVQLTCFKNEKK